MSSPQSTQPIDPNPPNYVDNSEISPGNFGKPFILNRVFDLLVLMIDVLQRTAAAQANRLNFLTQWQKAYTDELNQIHSFQGGNGDMHGFTNLSHDISAQGSNDFGPTAGTIRGELNSQNSIYTQEIQSRLNVASNDAKALQANVNQTNDAVQSQSDMATSILQQLSTILTALYQSA